MARAEWGYNSNSFGRGGPKWCSYKRTTIIICSINIGVALYVLHNLYTSLYAYPYHDSQTAVRYTPDQIRNMEESIRIRKASEPIELIELVKQIKNKFYREEELFELPQHLKRKITDEIVLLLRGLNASANATVQHDSNSRTGCRLYTDEHTFLVEIDLLEQCFGYIGFPQKPLGFMDDPEAVESWRKQKLEEAKKMTRGKMLNSTIQPEEAGMLARALDSNWAELSEEIGLWIPVQIINKEHDDKPEGEEDFEPEILAGKKLPPECNTQLHTDYDGAAVRWGLTHHKESAFDCCQACLDHARNVKPGEMKCNVWVYCPAEEGCHSPDRYQHKLQECWLKHAEKPKVNFKDKYSESYRNAHPNAPLVVPWVSGVISA